MERKDGYFSMRKFSSLPLKIACLLVLVGALAITTIAWLGVHAISPTGPGPIDSHPRGPVSQNVQLTGQTTTATVNSTGITTASTLAVHGQFTTFRIPDANFRPDPNGIVKGPDGAFWFTEEDGDQIARMTPTGVFTEFTLPANTSPFCNFIGCVEPTNITVGPDGALWFTENSNNAIGRITTSGHIHVFPLPTTCGGFGCLPQDITKGPDGALWFTENFNGNRIGRITTAGVITEFTTGITAGSQPAGITKGPDNNLWFTEEAANKIGRINPTTHVVTEFATGITAFSEPTDITAGPDGALWFTENQANKIGRITTTGTVTEFTTGLTASSGLDGITRGLDGKLWFAEQDAGKIGRITTTGTITEFTVPIPCSNPTVCPEPSEPIDIISVTQSVFWFTEAGGQIIAKLTVN